MPWKLWPSEPWLPPREAESSLPAWGIVRMQEPRSTIYLKHNGRPWKLKRGHLQNTAIRYIRVDEAHVIEVMEQAI